MNTIIDSTSEAFSRVECELLHFLSLRKCKRQFWITYEFDDSNLIDNFTGAIKAVPICNLCKFHFPIIRKSNSIIYEHCRAHIKESGLLGFI